MDRSRLREHPYQPRHRDDREYQTRIAYDGSWDRYGPRPMVPISTSHHLDQADHGHHSYVSQHWEYATLNTDWYSSNPQSQTAAWEQAYSSGRTASKDTFPLGGIPRPPTRRQPKILLKTGSRRSNLTASLAGGTPYTGRGRTGAPARPRGGTAPAAQPHPPPPGPKGQDFPAPLPRRNPVGSTTVTPERNQGTPDRSYSPPRALRDPSEGSCPH